MKKDVQASLKVTTKNGRTIIVEANKYEWKERVVLFFKGDSVVATYSADSIESIHLTKQIETR